MTSQPTTQMDMQTHTLDAPSATITYDVRGDLADATPDRPVLVMFGSPMDASGFTTLATYFTDRPVVTYDPRGAGRSERTDDAAESTPEQHADDIRRVIEALGVGKVDLFASSGGAVNSLALVAAHPDLVGTLVAHEPPLAAFVPDREEVLAANRDIGDTYQRSGKGPAMAKFIQLVMVAGPLPASYADQPDPDPAMFGLPTDDDGSRNDRLLGQNNRTCVPYEPDLAKLRSASTRIVVAAGEESAQQLTGRSAAGLADALGTELTVFPSHHGGFLGADSGQQGEPARFAARLPRSDRYGWARTSDLSRVKRDTGYQGSNRRMGRYAQSAVNTGFRPPVAQATGLDWTNTGALSVHWLRCPPCRRRAT